jgi:hypothetical protein
LRGLNCELDKAKWSSVVMMSNATIPLEYRRPPTWFLKTRRNARSDALVAQITRVRSHTATIVLFWCCFCHHGISTVTSNNV